MADPNDITTDLAALHNAIQNQIGAAFPALQTVEFYRDDEDEGIQLPACLIELDEMENRDEDPGTGQICMSLRFSARLILTRENGPDAPMQARLSAAALSAFINKNRFGGHVSPAHVLMGSRDDFSPSLLGRFSIWRIEWVHREAFFGASVWSGDNIIPQTVYLGRAPEIGPDHIEDYKEIWKSDT